MICDNCDYAGRPSYAYPCSKCDMKEWSLPCMYEHTKKKTNGDVIRAYSDDELAKWLTKTLITHVEAGIRMFNIYAKVSSNSEEDIEKGCLEWLQQHAEVE